MEFNNTPAKKNRHRIYSDADAYVETFEPRAKQ